MTDPIEDLRAAARVVTHLATVEYASLSDPMRQATLELSHAVFRYTQAALLEKSAFTVLGIEFFAKRGADPRRVEEAVRVVADLFGVRKPKEIP